jgi:hypothetical protein
VPDVNLVDDVAVIEEDGVVDHWQAAARGLTT